MWLSLLVICASALAQTGPPQPPDRALPDSTYFPVLYDWIWNNYLFTQPDTAFKLAQDMWVQAEQHERPVSAARARDLQGITWYVRGEPLKAIEISRSSIPVYQKAHDTQGLASVLGNLGAFYQRVALYDSALAVLHRAIDVQRSRNDMAGAANSRNILGSVYMERGDLFRALDEYRAVLVVSERLGDSALMALSEGNIGTVYAKQDILPNAIEHLQRSALIFRRMNDQPNLISALLNLGGAFNTMGDTANGSKYLIEAYTMSERIGDGRSMATTLINLGEMRGKAGDHAEALAAYDRGLVLARPSEDAWTIGQLLMNRGAALLELGRTVEAAESGEQALSMARKEGIVAAMRDAAELLAKVYQKQGKWQQALTSQLLFTQLRDSLKNEENERAVIGFDLRRGYEKEALADSLEHRAEIVIEQKETQKQRLVRNGFMGGFVLVALFAGVFFTQRNRISKEKARSEELLLNILPAEVAEELKAKGSADAVQIDQVTVLFSDFKGFTSLSEKLTPRELVRDLNECFSAFDHIMTKYGIEKIKTIGDAYMAAGGLPVPNATHAVDVIKAGLEMRDFIAEGKARKVAAGQPFFEIRIGIHTGPVVAGIVGVKKFAYDIWGDTVNTASRMESSGEVGQVNISEATYAQVKDDPGLTFTSRGKVKAKGKGEVEMFFVEKAS